MSTASSGQFAADHDRYLIDFRDGVEVLEVGAVQDREYPTIDVTTSLEGVAGETVFRLRQAPSGNWKVHQVIVPGGDEEQIPWALPPVPEPEKVRYDVEFMVPCPPGGFEARPSDPSSPSIRVEPGCGDPGSFVTVSGEGFPPSIDGVVLFIPDSEYDVSRLMTDFETNPSGTFSVRVEVPQRESDVVQHFAVEVVVP